MRSFECRASPPTEEEILHAERQLGVRFPEDYRLFLARFGYASWFGHFICGISDNTQYSVVDATDYERSQSHAGRKLPKHCVVLDTDCVMFCEPSNSAGRVQAFLTGVTPEEKFGWSNFFDFLRYKLG